MDVGVRVWVRVPPRTHTRTHTHTHTGLAVHFDCARGACWEADWSCVNRDRQGCVWIVLTTPSRQDWSEVRRLSLSWVLRRGWFCGQTLPLWSKSAFLVKSGGLNVGRLLKVEV